MRWWSELFGTCHHFLGQERCKTETSHESVMTGAMTFEVFFASRGSWRLKDEIGIHYILARIFLLPFLWFLPFFQYDSAKNIMGFEAVGLIGAKSMTLYSRQNFISWQNNWLKKWLQCMSGKLLSYRLLESEVSNPRRQQSRNPWANDYISHVLLSAIPFSNFWIAYGIKICLKKS